MTTVLTAANHELFRRPPEEHFGSWEEIRTAAAEQRKGCRNLDCKEKEVLFSESGTVYPGESAVSPTHYSMTQLAGMSRVPMALLERLKPETRASVLNQTFRRGRKHPFGPGRSSSPSIHRSAPGVRVGAATTPSPTVPWAVRVAGPTVPFRGRGLRYPASSTRRDSPECRGW